MMNIINGGAHADNPIDIQEFMIMPAGAETFSEGLRMGAEIFHSLKSALKKAGHNTNVGDEGGFAPNLSIRPKRRWTFIMQAGEGGRLHGAARTSGWPWTRPPRNSSRMANTRLIGRGSFARRRVQMADYLAKCCADAFPICLHRRRHERRMISRDGHAITELLGDRVQLVGDDLFVTNPDPSWRTGIEKGLANSMLVKVNQIGTLSARRWTPSIWPHRAAYTCVMSHRSGETEDATIADLAVATNCGQIKTGSLARSDRLAKYNQLLRIEELLGDQAVYAGVGVIRG